MPRFFLSLVSAYGTCLLNLIRVFSKTKFVNKFMRKLLVTIDRDKMRTVRGELSQAAFGRKIGLSQRIICDYEIGRRQPSLDTLALYGEIVGQPVEYFLIQSNVATA